MRALFFIQGFDVAASRYRVLNYLPGLNARGITATAADFPRRLSQVPGALEAARSADTLFLQRKQLGAPLLSLLRAATGRLIYDFDDSLWVRSAKHAENRSFTRELRFARMVSRADHVVAGNSFLAERAARANPNVTVIPTPIDVTRYTVRPEEHDPNRVTVGWIGAHASIHYLERLRDALCRAHERDRRLRLKIICDVFPEFGALPVDRVAWSAATEAAELATFDIGIMPLLEDDWSRGKCGLKALQCMAAGVPVVVTPVGINADLVVDGVEGFHASTSDTWVERMLLLAGDSALRRRMGLRARAAVEERYSLATCLPVIERVLRGDGAKPVR